MGETALFTSNLLKIEVTESKDSISMEWTGKSIDREPGKFVTPLLVNVLRKSSDRGRRVILDFRRLDYMNSSTITPIVKVLERAKRGKIPVTVVYQKALKWQDLNFSALEIFQTNDQRVEIKGL